MGRSGRWIRIRYSWGGNDKNGWWIFHQFKGYTDQYFTYTYSHFGVISLGQQVQRVTDQIYQKDIEECKALLLLSQSLTLAVKRQLLGLTLVYNPCEWLHTEKLGLFQKKNYLLLCWTLSTLQSNTEVWTNVKYYCDWVGENTEISGRYRSKWYKPT